MIQAANQNGANGVKPTKQEHHERVQMVRKLLGRCLSPGEISAAMTKRYGITRRTVENYLSRARAMMRAETGLSREDLQAESVEFYRGVASSDKEKTRDRLLARERIDKVLGLDAPQKLAGPDGGPLTLTALLAASCVVPSLPPSDAPPANQFDVDAYLEVHGNADCAE